MTEDLTESARAIQKTGAAHMLLVDDDPALVSALSGTLHARFRHFALDTCDSGVTALEFAKGQKYDAIIVDVNMPSMNGLEFLTEVRVLQPQTPVLMITAAADPTTTAQAMDGGAVDCIPKPFERGDFVRAVRRALRLSRLLSFATKLERRRRTTLETAGGIRQELRQHSAQRFAAQRFQHRGLVPNGLHGPGHVTPPLTDSPTRR